MERKVSNGGRFLPPRIDSRNMNGFIEKMKEMVPFYTPEWRFSPEDPDVGTALFFIVADMLQENIKRLNQVPLQQFIAFMNLIDVSLIPAQPAKTYLTFALNEGTQQSVLVSKGVQVAASTPDDDGKVIFETDNVLLVTPASLVALYNVSAPHDRIVWIADQLEAHGPGGTGEAASLSLPFFQHHIGENLQEHIFYIQHDDQLFLEHGAIIRLEWTNSLKRYTEEGIPKMLGNTEWTEWSYYTEEGWQTFDQITYQGNVLTLQKAKTNRVETCEVGDVTGRWLRCRLRTEKPEALSILHSDLEMDVVRMHTEYLDHSGQGPIAPDTLFMNDIELDPDGFYPFAEQFMPYTSFYLSCPEALSKKGSLITLHFSAKAIPIPLSTGPEPEINWKMIMKRSEFEEKEPPKVWIQQVLWEYWNGNSWVTLDTPDESEMIFRGLYTEITEEIRISFRCPHDLEQTFVNSQFSYWIRLRVLTIDHIYAPETVYMSPWMEQVGFRYEYENRFYPVQRFLTWNNLQLQDCSLASKQAGNVFQPFYGVDGKQATVYFGFDKPPLKGPISLYFAVQQQKYTYQDAPLVEWEYMGNHEGKPVWSGLKVIDETRGFTQSGIVQFAGPPDISPDTLFGKQLYWLRAVNRDQVFERGDIAAPIIHNIYTNTVRATQQETIQNETPDRLLEEYQLTRPSVIEEEVWVDETGYLSENEIAEILAQDVLTLQVIRDSNGYLQRVWVKWLPVDNFLGSSPFDRHYVMNRSAGTFQFGDGTRGKIPPNTGMDKIKVNYRVSEGERGNVAVGKVNELQNSIAFIQSAVNHVAAGGGANTETLAEALQRGPQTLKHQQRAVTTSDFEWLARQIYPNIAHVKCLANTNVKMEKEAGCVTLVVLSKEGMAGQIFFPELQKKVEKYLLEHTASTLSFPRKISVIEPAYLEISITVTVTVSTMEEVVPTEIACMEKLNLFLDPFHGQHDGKGWKIGEPVHLSMFYALLKSVSSVINIERLYMTAYKWEDGQRIEISTNQLGMIPHGMVVNGMHKVTVIHQ